MKQFIVVFVAALCLFFAAGCGGQTAETPAPPDGENGAAARQGAEGEGGAVIRQDADGLVSVSIENGKAALTFDNSGTAREGPFPIEASGRVRDACIGIIEALSGLVYSGSPDFAAPAVILLMEDGSLEYTVASPNAVEHTGAFYSFGKVPWLKDIVSLSYESDGEGLGEMTVFAEDESGKRYEVRLPC